MPARRAESVATETKFACEECGKEFEDIRNLNRHKALTKHAQPTKSKLNGKGSSSEKPVKQATKSRCPECGMEFTLPIDLGRHRRFKHGIVGKIKQKALEQARSPSSTNDQAQVEQPKPTKQTKAITLVCAKCGEGPFRNVQQLGAHHRFKHGAGFRRQTNHNNKGVKSTELVRTGDQNGQIRIERRSNQHDIEKLFAYTLGQLEAIVKEVAYQNDLPAKQFARGCAEYFQLAANR